MVLSLRNTFRRKARLALTMVTLTLGGAIFIAVFSVRDSLASTLELANRYDNFDVPWRSTAPTVGADPRGGAAGAGCDRHGDLG